MDEPAVAPERWAIEVGLDDAEWQAFLVLRAHLCSTPVPCPWCAASGVFESEGSDRTCPGCEGSGSSNAWREWSAPGPWENDGSNEPPPPSQAPDPAWTALEQRLDGLAVTCPLCGGSGYRCVECGKSGRISAIAAAVRETVACLRCGGDGWGGALMLEWPCAYCLMEGRIALTELDRLGTLSVGENYFGWWSIADLVFNGEQAAYPDARDDLDPRVEAKPSVCWSGIDFGEDDLSGLDLSEADLQGCTMRHLRGTKLRQANLQDARLDGADAVDADFTGADLAGASLADADLSGSTIEQAATLEEADLTGVAGLTPDQIRRCRDLGAVLGDPD
jgi:hypothetical protein